jgi:fructose-specific phosphotransferase system IIC component
MSLADISTSLEHLLSGQSGVTLGLVMGGILTALGLKLYVSGVGKKLDESIAATDRLCRTVANLLISSELKSLQQIGRDTISELDEARK